MTKVLIGFLFAIFVFLIANYFENRKKPKEIIAIIDTDTICTEDSFSVKDFVLELHLQGIKYPDIVLKQACLESGYFTSGIWEKKNNPFGFYVSIDSTHGEYILFNDWRSSVAYYKGWQDKRYKGGDYYEFLDKIGYAIDTTYLEKVKNIDLRQLEDGY